MEPPKKRVAKPKTKVKAKANGNGKSKAQGKKQAPDFVVAARVKEYNTQAGLRTSGEFDAALNGTIAIILADAHKRCAENKRQTLKPCDL